MTHLLRPDWTEDLSNAELAEIEMHAEAVSVANTAVELPGLRMLMAAMVAEQEEHRPQTLCDHCNSRQFVGAWLDRSGDVVCLCGPCADTLPPDGQFQ